MQYPTITDPSLALEYKMKQGKGAKANRVFPREYTGHSKHSLPKTKETILQMDITKSVQLIWSVISDSLRAHELQHARLSCLSLTPGVCSQSCPLSQWCHPTISSSVVPFSSRLQPFPASGSFPMKRPLFKCNWLSLKMIQRQPQSTRGLSSPPPLSNSPQIIRLLCANPGSVTPSRKGDYRKGDLGPELNNGTEWTLKFSKKGDTLIQSFWRSLGLYMEPSQKVNAIIRLILRIPH